MATVRITPNLRASIQRALVAPYEERIHKIRLDIENDTELGELIYNCLIPPAIQTTVRGLMVLDETWVQRIENIRVRITLEDKDRHFMLSVKLPTTKAFPVPARFSRWGSDAEVSPEQRKLIRAHVQSRLDQLIKLEEETKSIQEELLVKVVDKCGSLKQVEQLWPSVLQYVPQDIKERHMAPSARQSRKKALEEVEVSDLAKQLLVKNRMIQNAQQ